MTGLSETRGLHMFIDEGKARGYGLVGVWCEEGLVRTTRMQLRALLLPGQQRIHFSSERDRRRSMILDVLAEGPFTVVICAATLGLGEWAAREACLRGLLRHPLAQRMSQATIELDDTLLPLDRRIMFEMLHRDPVRRHPAYRWVRAREEPGLWIADAFAWAFTKGGAWWRRVERKAEVVSVEG